MEHNKIIDHKFLFAY